MVASQPTRGDDEMGLLDEIASLRSGHIMVTAAYAKQAAEAGIHYPPDWIDPQSPGSAIAIRDAMRQVAAKSPGMAFTAGRHEHYDYNF
jgi:hypothetical protein